jgi:hypothetical protein
MRNMLLAAVFALCFSRLVSADPISPPPGVDLCAQYNICGTPTTIEVELGGKGTDTWTDVIELHEVSQPYWFYFADGTSLPPGSIWVTFLWPPESPQNETSSWQEGLSSPLTWRDDTDAVAVPEPSSLALLCLGLCLGLGSRRRGEGAGANPETRMIMPRSERRLGSLSI